MKPGPPLPHNIAIFRALPPGELLCLTPTLRALRAAAPDARITLIGLPSAARFVERFSMYLDAHFSFPGFPGLPEQPARLAEIGAFFGRAQRHHFDLALQLHGDGGLSNSLTVLLGARRSAGFYLTTSYCPDRTTYLPWSDLEADAERGLRLLASLGIPNQGRWLEFPLRAEDHAALAELRPPATSYACLHAGARVASHRWLPQRYAAVGDWLAEQGLQVVLTGELEESEIARSVENAMLAPVQNFGGRTSQGTMAALLAGARVVVCNDTGVAHLAAALQTPAVVICCGANSLQAMPSVSHRQRLLHSDVACRPCSYARCPIAHPCANLIEADAVIKHLRELLA